jgi:F-type H+-transporting ATPase subunit b
MVKRTKRIIVGMLCCAAVVTIWFMVDPGRAWAEENGGNWRNTYDEVMIWVNFAILALIFYKFGKDPLLDFLRLRKEDLAHEIGLLESKKEKLNARIEETRQAITDSDAQFSELKEKILKQGERRRQEIIEEAREQSRMMMDATKQKVGSLLQRAKRRFRAELVDAAIDRAAQKLPEVITDEDNRNFLDQYMASATSK